MQKHSSARVFHFERGAENCASESLHFYLLSMFWGFFFFRQVLEGFQLLTTANRSSPAGPIVLSLPRQMVDYKHTEYGEMC